MNRSVRPFRDICSLGAAAALLLAALALNVPAGASPQTSSSSQTGSKPAAQVGDKPDYSKEAYIFENVLSASSYQNDGTATQRQTFRVLIQSNAGQQAFGILHFPYPSAMVTMHIDYIRVRKPNGAVIETPPAEAMDITPDISREAPTYSDLRDKQVAVKGLGIGDTLEYQMTATDDKPLIPGQFWFSENFMRGAVVLDQEIKVDVPRDRYVQVKSTTVQPTVSDRDGRRVYDWKNANLQPTSGQNKDDAQKQNSDDSADADKPPDIQLTTFRSWDEVGQWFKSVAEPQAAVTPAIKAKADEISASAKSDADKIHALYDFVSLKFRYVGISLGIGRYQPHAAEEVLGNEFGDCKDKHTLFAALLAAENIKAVPVLINSSAKIDPDVPSPGQFDHVITAVLQGSSYQYLDTTPEVAPYGMLTANLRGKQALLIPAEGPAALAQTPKDLPFPFFSNYATAATLDSSGALVGINQMILRGDDEMAFRAVLRQVGPGKWNDAIQDVTASWGFAGTVSEVSVTPPEATGSPLRIIYKYDRKDFSDFKDGQITPPIPPFFLPEAPENNSGKPIEIGAPDDMFYQATIRLPRGSAPYLPPTLVLHEPYADYHSGYFLVDGDLHVHRRLTIKLTEVTADEIDSYRSFVKRILEDENTFIPLKGGTSDASAGPFSANEFTQSGKVRELFAKAQEASERRDGSEALRFAQQAVEVDPTFWRSWAFLGGIQIAARKDADGLACFKRAIELYPDDPTPYNMVAGQLTRNHRADLALEIWRDLKSARPGFDDPSMNIAAVLNRQGKYAEAAKELDPFAQTPLADEGVFAELGKAYLHLPTDEAKQKAGDFLVRAGDMAITEADLNDAAWSLADNDLRLDDARRIAQNAVRRIETVTLLASLSNPDLRDARRPLAVGSLWDTLAWAEFKLGHLDVAEKYLVPAWNLSQDPTIGNHLGLVYEKEGKKHEAALAYAGALSAKGAAPLGTRELLDAVQLDEKDKVTPDPAMLEKARTVALNWQPADPQQTASADFFVLLAPAPGGSKVLDVKFVSGSEALQDAAKALALAPFDFNFPDDGPVQIVRRGKLTCEPSDTGSHCAFVMYRPADVTSVN